MKLNPPLLAVSLLSVAALCSCGKNEPTAPAVVEAAPAVKAEAPKAVEPAAPVAPVAPPEAPKIVAAPPAAEAPVTPAPAPVEAAKVAEDTSIQDMIASARSLVAEKKYVEASTVVQQLGNKALNTDQTTLVESLKLQIKNALAAKATEKAAGALGNLLQK
jgi:hypothetical protein